MLQEKRKIDIIYGGTFSKNELKYPGASIFSSDGQQVQFQHQGIDVWCNMAIYYQEQNVVKAFGDVYLQQGDSIKMNSAYIEYNGNTKQAVAREKVSLRNETTTLTTEELFFDRNIQEVFYNSFGTVTDQDNVLTSQRGRYLLEPKKYQFVSEVIITNPEFNVSSQELDYYTDSRNAYLYGPTTIIGEDYVMYCERGFYDTKIEQGYGVKNTRIDYDQKIIKGDSVFFDKQKQFAASTNNIHILDTVNNGIVQGHYAEVWKAQDSMFVTKKAVAISLVDNDSMFIHGDKLMVTGKEGERVIRAFNNARFYKSDLSGKCDSIHSSQKTGITQLIKRPILWSGENQMTGDSIHLISNLETEKLDSLKVINNAFIIEKDTLGDGYNQTKGKNLYGKFRDNRLYEVDIVQNTEVIYHIYDDSNVLTGINKTICSAINITFDKDQKIEEITFIQDADGEITPEEDLPTNARRLLGFVWYGEERIRSKEDLFDQDDLAIELVKIRGIDNPIDIDTEEQQRQGIIPKVDPNKPSTNTAKKQVPSKE